MDTVTSTSSSKVYLVDDAVEVRRRLARLLAAIPGVEIVGESEDADGALQSILTSHADVAVLDLRLAGKTNFALIEALSRAQPSIVKIILTNYSGAAFRRACVAAGADFFFDKTSEFDKACRTIKSIVNARAARPAE
ncbi:response regulator [Paraburkholderia hospita]|uniref:response regulator n=1 Tax=Paraburkholderia hospita TaxID=169430 RepID=UPI000B3427A5|nr:response regulator [Paraburkholderia hospita]OUL95673.1 two-component system response regulator [Paraburkholderia hospita]